MNAIELFHKDGSTANRWYCFTCRAIYLTEEGAEACHGSKRCKECNEELHYPFYAMTCSGCSDKLWRLKMARIEAINFEKANKINASEYAGTWVFLNDRYYESLQDVIDDYDVAPSYVWATTNTGLRKANIEDIVEPILDDAWEDASIMDLHGVDELSKAIDAFNEANAGIPVYIPDFENAIMLDAESLGSVRLDR